MMAMDDYKQWVINLRDEKNAGKVTNVQVQDKMRAKFAAMTPEEKAAAFKLHFSNGSPPYDPRFPNQNQTR